MYAFQLISFQLIALVDHVTTWQIRVTTIVWLARTFKLFLNRWNNTIVGRLKEFGY